jgi:hypothetical protein
MDRDVLMFAQVMFVIVSSVAGFTAIGLGARVLWRMGAKVKPRYMSSSDDNRMDRLETAVDAIAIEVERISEAQRFTAALLAERLPTRGELGSAGSIKRVNTPH